MNCPPKSLPDCSAFNECECPWEEEQSKENVVSMFFWFDGVTRLVIAGVGLFGNIFTIIILNSRELKSTFHMFLAVLAGFDLCYLFPTFLEEVPQMEDIIHQKTTYPYQDFMKLRVMSITMCILSTFSVTFEFANSYHVYL